MARKINNPQLGIYRIDTLKTGEYVKRIIGGRETNKVYKLAGWDASERKYQLDDCEDISRCVYLSSTAFVQAGFTY